MCNRVRYCAVAVGCECESTCVCVCVPYNGTHRRLRTCVCGFHWCNETKPDIGRKPEEGRGMRPEGGGVVNSKKVGAKARLKPFKPKAVKQKNHCKKKNNSQMVDRIAGQANWPARSHNDLKKRTTTTTFRKYYIMHNTHVSIISNKKM